MTKSALEWQNRWGGPCICKDIGSNVSCDRACMYEVSQMCVRQPHLVLMIHTVPSWHTPHSFQPGVLCCSDRLNPESLKQAPSLCVTARRAVCKSGHALLLMLANAAASTLLLKQIGRPLLFERFFGTGCVATGALVSPRWTLIMQTYWNTAPLETIILRELFFRSCETSCRALSTIPVRDTLQRQEPTLLLAVWAGRLHSHS